MTLLSRPSLQLIFVAPLGLSLLALSIAAHAGGFALDGPGSAAMGNSYAGQVTGAHDLSDLFANPAVLTQFPNKQVIADNLLLNYSIKISEGATARTATDANIDLTTNGSAGTNGGNTLYIPALYASQALSDKTYFGFGVSVPWGIKSNYPDQWVGRYQAIDSEITSLNLTPVIAHRWNNQLSVAGGVQLQYLDAKMSSAIDFGSVVGLGPNAALDGKAEVTGDNWAFGYQLGLLYAPTEYSRFGISYISKIHHDLQGKTDFAVPDVLVDAVTATGAFVDTDVSFDITTPEKLTIGWQQRIAPQVELVTDAVYTRWSRVKSLVINSDNPNQPDDVTVFDWQNNWRYSAGLNYFYSPELTLRTGIGYEGTAVTQAYFGPRVPIPNKYLLSFGASYHVSDRWSVDVAYTHEFFETGYSALAVDNANPFRGSLNTQYNLGFDAVAASVKFDL